MRAALVLLTIATLTSSAVAAGGATDEACALYLAVRERLAPCEVGSRAGLSLALGNADTHSVEVFGEVSGMACSAAEPEGDLPRTVMLTLDDGSCVTVRADADVDALRVGDRVALIATVARNTTPRELVVEAWVLEWDLPAPEDEAEQPPAPDDDGGGIPAGTAPGDGAFPQPAAATAFRADVIDVWKAWALEHNSRLSDEQATNIVTWVLQYAQRYDVNHILIFALIKWESWFDPSCRSHAGAIGLMQLMPGTARSLGVDPRNVQQNIDGGVHYLAEQLETYRARPTYERVILALACYNAGPNAVARAGHHVPRITETQRYVRKVSDTFYELHQAGMP